MTRFKTEPPEQGQRGEPQDAPTGAIDPVRGGGPQCHDPLCDAELERLIEGLNALPLGFSIFDKSDRLLFCNSIYHRLLGGDGMHVRKGERMVDICRRIFQRGEAPAQFKTEQEFVDYRLEQHHNVTRADEARGQDGTQVEVLRVKLDTGDVVVARRDITELREAQAALESQAAELKRAGEVLARQALRDPLTGLANRRAWDQHLADTTSLMSDKPLVILSIDLDGFKRVNDRLGHAAGDAVLTEVAARLTATLDSCEIVARVGGDEFLAAMRLKSGVHAPEALARRLVDVLPRPVSFEHKRCDFGVSVGVAIGTGPHQPVEELAADADSALYRSKTHGRNSFCVFTSAMRATARRRRRLADDLGEAIADRSVTPLFQIKVRASDRRPVGAEALARWRHPDFGLMPPCDFLDLADMLKLTADVDRVVLEQTLEAQRIWAAEGAPIPNVSVNVSARRLQDPDLLKGLHALNITPGAISFELIETTFLDQLDAQSRWNLDGIHELGIGIDLDDFGTGHASVAALLAVRPQRIKIDRSLIALLGADDDRRKMVPLIVSMGQALDAAVVAEGVETLEQAALLADMGCDELQGYAFSKPAPAEAMPQIVRRFAEAPADAPHAGR